MTRGMRMKIKYFALRPLLLGSAPANLFSQKDELYLSANLRLCGFNGMAHIESASLAKQFRDACMPSLCKRYGDTFALEVTEWSSSENRRTREEIERDSALIRERLASGNFTPNRRRTRGN